MLQLINPAPLLPPPPLAREKSCRYFQAVCFSCSDKGCESYRGRGEEGGEGPISVQFEVFLLWKDALS